MRVALLALALVGCAPTSAPTKLAGVNLTTSPLGRHACSPSQSAAGATIAALTLDVLRKRGELLPGDPVHVCVVAGAERIWCSGAYVRGCALPYRGGPRLYVAGGHSAWRRTLAHEVLAGLAHVGRLKGWPRAEFAVVADPRYTAALAAVTARLP